MVGWAKSRGEGFFRTAVWNQGVSWRSETMDAANSHLSFPHTWRNGTGAVSGSFRVFLTTVHIRLPQAQGNECLLYFSVQLGEIRLFTDPLSVLLLVSVRVNSGSE